ncbi:methyl-accepting chemotaxis protein [Herminiimonas aquatilis]|uniref:Methyl-accepting chemotaxis protein n=1 Tax=Herminiimonas aquatilis TaxID=345342 RepID=A0ABW2J7T2_9BURK
MSITHIKIGTRLTIGFSILLIFVAAISGIAYWRLQGINATITEMIDQVLVKERLVSQWQENTNLNGTRALAIAQTDDATKLQKMQSKIKETSAKISELQKELDKFEKTAEETALLESIAEKRKHYIAMRDSVMKEKTINPQQAQELVSTKLEPALEDYVNNIKQLAVYQSDLITRTTDRTKAEAYNASLLLLGLGAVAAMFGILIAFFITASIKNQLGGEPAYAVDVANRIASGDLGVSISTRDGDTVSLLFAIKAMRDSIANIVGEVRKGTDSIAIASREIAAGNLDLSSRTEEQAGALEETASSMEELTSTVNQNADNARQANQLAVSASDVAVQGGVIVSQVINTMSDINTSARKIVDIISVIEGIAFQTNILALNAAVEAARAGEQGRGFAVVASEVRNLAQRSSAAAKEIKTLIDDSVEKVDIGTGLVDRAGATMGEIVTSVKRVTDIMEELTAASREQSSGIGQINQAIAQMDQVTQQNAALVEEAAAAAESLQDQAGNLAQVVSVFKMAGEPSSNATRDSYSSGSPARLASKPKTPLLR